MAVRVHTLCAAAALLLGACTHPPVTAPRPVVARPATDGARSPVRPYRTVITAAAKTRDGLFKTHQVGDRLYFEIPRVALNRDMLLVGRYARSGGRVLGPYGGDEFAERTLRWERQQNKVLVRSPSYELVADSTLPVYRAVQQATYAPIIAILPVEAYGSDSAPVVDVTRLYTTAIPEFAARTERFDEKRSFIERALAFPRNVEVEATQTFGPPVPPGGYPPGLAIPAQSVLAHWSMVLLPDRPMMPRVFDDRVGYFSVEQLDVGTPQHRTVKRSYITRWRLEKRDPTAAVSDPVEPITYYIDPATPAQWVPWIKRGIEDWQPAFEAAGFSRAIVARVAPEGDPDWSPDDVRHTVVRWLPSPIENAVGPHVHDPRTGEILNGSIKFYQNIMSLVRDWYVTQVGPLDPRVRTLPMPDSLMGRLLEYVVAHEVGHTLGFQHNMKASAEYPADSVRSPTWVRRMGHTPTLMDYARFNYVAQPSDGIALEDLIPRVGPYDMFATRWGYAPIAGARSPDAEKPTLDAWARAQDTVPWFRFSTSGANGADPGEETEAVGDADPVASETFGLRNIKRVVPMLIPAAVRPGEDNSDLQELYDALVMQWTREMAHVVRVVGGVRSQEKYGGQPGPRFAPISRARQQAAMRFVAANVLETPRFLVDTSILRRLEPAGALDRIRAAQGRLLALLLDDGRLARLIEFEALAPSRRDVYTAATMLSDVRRAAWSELSRPAVSVDVFRRNLQRAYLDQLDTKVNAQGQPGGPSGSEARALLRGQLAALDEEIRAALPRVRGDETRLHLLDVRHEITNILTPRTLVAPGPVAPSPTRPATTPEPGPR